MRHVVSRAQVLVVARPFLGDFQEFAVAAHAVAVHSHLNAPARLPESHVPLLPGERVIGAGLALLGLGFDKVEIGKRAVHGVAQEFFRQGARGGFVQARSRGVLRNLVVVADDLAARGHIHTVFFDLLRPEPAVRPPPQMQAAVGQSVEPLQSLGALEVDLRLVVVIENAGVAVTRQTRAPIGEKTESQRLGIVAVDAKDNRSFRESPPKVLDAEGHRGRSDEQPCSDDPEFARGKFNRHGGFRLANWTRDEMGGGVPLPCHRARRDHPSGSDPSHLTITQAAWPGE